MAPCLIVNSATKLLTFMVAYGVFHVTNLQHNNRGLFHCPGENAQRS
jgi:hypothetical protein